MRLKPGLFQLIVVFMTSSLIVSCNTSPKGTQVDCNDPAFKQSKDCKSSSSTSGGVYRGSGNTNNLNKSTSSEGGSGTSGVIVPGNLTGGSRSGIGNSNGEAPSQVGSQGKSNGASNSSSKTGRGGFGSFGRGSSGG